MDEILIFFTLSFLRNGHKAMKKQWLLQGQGGRLLERHWWLEGSSTRSAVEIGQQHWNTSRGQSPKVEEKLIVMWL